MTTKRTTKSKVDKLQPLLEEARRVIRAAFDLEALPSHPEVHYQAQEEFYGAMELKREEAVIKRLIKAIRINPNHVDAISVLMPRVYESEEERLEGYQKLVDMAKRDLGEDFEAYEGEFWGFIETRPYMRARHNLAGAFQAAGQQAAAIREYEAMIRLNPNDNQGVRYELMGLLLESADLPRMDELLKQYPDEWSAVWGWGKVLYHLLKKDEAAALAQLEEARKINSHAEVYLNGTKKIPEDLPPYYQPGTESEAIVCAVEIAKAWEKHPVARQWLWEQG